MEYIDVRRLFRNRERRSSDDHRERRSSDDHRERRSSDDEASVDMADPKQKPKLERRNAVKNFDYDALTSSSSSASSSDGISALRTRSLDMIPIDKNTSFRIEGIEGEFDRLCETLGLSGPEDFAIPAAAWEARKARSSSDIFPRSRFSRIDRLNKPEEEKEEGLNARVRVNDEAAELLDLTTSNDSNNWRNPLSVSPSAANACSGDGGGAAGGGGGIKGVRPPLLTPPPMQSRYVDDMSAASSWDIMRSFAPEGERGLSSCPVRRFYSSASDKEDEVGVGGESGEGEELTDGEVGEREKEHQHGVRPGETTVISESSIFLTSNDEDSSSATTETTFNISPDGIFRRSITSWQRGDLLGSGSFGTVYEAFTE